MNTLALLDWIVLALYFVLVFGVAWWFTRREHVRDSSTGYFLAGRNMGWFVIGASLFASNIGSEHLVGLAGAGAARGVAVGQFEVLASLILLLLGWVFVPFYLRSGVTTMPEFLERRYSPAARWYLAIISVVGYVLTKISVTIAAGGIVFGALMGLDFWVGALIVVAATGIYTVTGRPARRAGHRRAAAVRAGAGVGHRDRDRPERTGRRGRDETPGRRRLHGHVAADERPRLPLDRHPAGRPHPGRVVLVHRPVHRPARSGRAQHRPGPRRHHLRRIS